MAQVTVDGGKCVLTGMCESVAPQLFEIQDDLVVLQPEVDGELVELARRAARECPTRALTVD